MVTWCDNDCGLSLASTYYSLDKYHKKRVWYCHRCKTYFLRNKDGTFMPIEVNNYQERMINLGFGVST